MADTPIVWPAMINPSQLLRPVDNTNWTQQPSPDPPVAATAYVGRSTAQKAANAVLNVVDLDLNQRASGPN